MDINRIKKSNLQVGSNPHIQHNYVDLAQTACYVRPQRRCHTLYHLSFRFHFEAVLLHSDGDAILHTNDCVTIHLSLSSMQWKISHSPKQVSIRFSTFPVQMYLYRITVLILSFLRERCNGARCHRHTYQKKRLS
jgi:hypothetical protein